MSTQRLRYRRRLAFLSTTLALVAAIACGADQMVSAGTPQSSVSENGNAGSAPSGGQFNRPGPALDVEGIAHWVNSDPVSIQDLLDEGKVVLVDFWTYTCVNCLRTLPFLQDWQEKYADRGLVILGVHSPEFEFEKDLDNVRDAVDDEGVTWPVALDNAMATWRSFGNRFWPAKYLMSPSEGLTYTHFGEGAYVETEEEIRAALERAGWDISGIPIGTIENSERDQSATTVTREIYGGYERSYHPQGLYAGDDEYYIQPDVTRLYVDDGDYRPQQFFLHGEWTNRAEAIVHARETEKPTDYIALILEARSANVVVEPQKPGEFRVYVTLDDEPLTPEEAGDDIEFDSEGNSYFTVDEARMYRVVEQPEFRSRLFKLSSTSDSFAVFAYTFGIYDGGF